VLSLGIPLIGKGSEVERDDANGGIGPELLGGSIALPEERMGGLGGSGATDVEEGTPRSSRHFWAEERPPRKKKLISTTQN
jgi:hypothetical protein